MNSAQVQKCLSEEKRAEFCELLANTTKRLGRQVKLRDDREEVKTELMEEIVRAKFTQNVNLTDDCGMDTSIGQPIQPQHIRDTVDLKALRAKAFYDKDKSMTLAFLFVIFFTASSAAR